ncbi:MAG: hypothetical protein V4734_06070 [Terriglobus sp.]
MKFAIAPLTLVTLLPGLAAAKGVNEATVPSRAVAIQSAVQLPMDATHTIERHGEPLSLICLGALFVGSAMFFTSRRSNA